jgi:hypothetical protein
MSVVSEWRDNLQIGLFFANQPYGATLNQALTNALGYNALGTYPNNDAEAYIRRFRRAQRLGAEKYQARIPGYFTINAQPFGTIFLYRAFWYTWLNPESGVVQAVPIADTDVAASRRFNDKYMAARGQTTRNIRTVDNVLRRRAALMAGDVTGVYAVESEMVTDGTVGELLSNQLGLPYVDFASILDQIGDGSSLSIQFNFSKTARKIQRLERDLQREQARIVNQLSTWITIKTGLPSNVRALALADAQYKLRALP